MPFDISRPTPYKKVRGDFIEKLPPTHYITLFHGTPTGMTEKGRVNYRTDRLYVCDGAVYTSEHDRVSLDDLQEKYPWFWDEYKKIEASLRREVKLALPEERVKNADELPDDFLTVYESLTPELREKLVEHVEKPTMWKCEECGEEVSTKKRGIHMINKHNKGKE